MTARAAAVLRSMQPIQWQLQCHYIVGLAIRSGALARPDRCERCGGNSGRIEGHHENYTKPLDVQWLCIPCHRRLHHVGGPVRLHSLASECLPINRHDYYDQMMHGFQRKVRAAKLPGRDRGDLGRGSAAPSDLAGQR